jgi:uncharacterized membrane protein
MIYATLKTLHVLSIIVWIGGMVFAHFFLRPAVAQLEPPVRLRLMHDVLGRFFQAVLAASLLTLASGVWMLGRVAKQVVQSGGSFEMPLAWTVMAVLGVAMVAIFMHIRFVLYKRLAGPLQRPSGPPVVRPGTDPHTGSRSISALASGIARDADALDDLSPDRFRASQMAARTYQS